MTSVFVDPAFVDKFGSLYVPEPPLPEKDELRVDGRIKAMQKQYQHIRVLGWKKAVGKITHKVYTVPADHMVREYLRTHPPPPGVDFDPSHYIRVDSCTQVQMAHLNHFDHPDWPQPVEYSDAINKAFDLVSELLRAETPLDFPHTHDLAHVPFSANRYAGVEYATQGMRTRIEADPVAQLDAERAWRALIDGKRVDPHFVQLAGRGKVHHLTKDEMENQNVPLAGRLILMMSHRDLKVCGVTERLLTQEYCKPHYPVRLCQTWFKGGASAFVDRFKPFSKFMCFDAKKFDACINSWMVRLALKLCRQQFRNGMDPRYDVYWKFVEESLLTPKIYRNDGLIFQKFVGTTSGHCFNTLLQSIITLLLSHAVLFVLRPDMDIYTMAESVHVECMGDDSVMGFSGPMANTNMKEIQSAMERVFHVDWSGKKSFVTESLCDPNSSGMFNGVQFLGKYFHLSDEKSGSGKSGLVIPYRPMKEMLARMLYPGSDDSSIVDCYLRAVGNYYDSAGNPESERWLRGYIESLKPHLPSEVEIPDTFPDHIHKHLSRDYSGVSKGLQFSTLLPTYEDWLRITTEP